MSLCPLVFSQLLKETLAPIPTMRRTAADIKREILARMERGTGEHEVHATPEQRREMGRWFVDELRRNAGSDIIIVPIVKQRLSR